MNKFLQLELIAYHPIRLHQH
ncbi:Protein of unknown function [Lactobacillus delbrueckii subsp. bulgaricus]|nr:Protein of unknown function [Lactobacillus delbrueckii subsp. bulgaricus]